MMAATEWFNTLWLVATGTGWSLVHALWMGAGLWVCLWPMLNLMKRRAAWTRYALTCGALVLLAGIPLRAGIASVATYDGHGEWSDRAATELMAEGAPAGMDGALRGGWSAEALRSAVNARHDSMSTPWISGSQAVGLSALLSLMALAWFVVAFARLARVGYGWTGALDLVRRSSPADERWIRLGDALARRLDIPSAHIGVSKSIDVPIQVGWLRPSILIPPTAHRTLNEREIESILAHELAHIRRGDYAVNLIQSVLEALLFFHPATAWISDRIRDEREYCSDDIARRSIRGTLADYVRTLTKLEQQRGGSGPDLAVAATDGSLLRRIRRLAALHSSSERPRLDVDMVALVVALVVLWLPWASVEAPIHASTLSIMQVELQQVKEYGALEVGAAMTHEEVRP